MEIFYINKNEFKNNHSKEELSQYADIEFKNEKRFYEHSIGRYLAKTLAKTHFGIKNIDITTDSKGKPFFKNNEIYFSISHTRDIVMICFDKNPCGLDIEYIKNRDISKLGQYYNTEFKTLNEFYDFWTNKEASYKLDCEPMDRYSSIIKDRYYLTVVSSEKFENIPTIKNLTV